MNKIDTKVYELAILNAKTIKELESMTANNMQSIYNNNYIYVLFYFKLVKLREKRFGIEKAYDMAYVTLRKWFYGNLISEKIFNILKKEKEEEISRILKKVGLNEIYITFHHPFDEVIALAKKYSNFKIRFMYKKLISNCSNGMTNKIFQEFSADFIKNNLDRLNLTKKDIKEMLINRNYVLNKIKSEIQILEKVLGEKI